MLQSAIHKWELKLSTRDNNRIVRPFEWGLEFLDGVSNGSVRGTESSSVVSAGATDGDDRTARDALFAFNALAIEDSARFFESLPVEQFQFDGHWLSFRSPVRTPYDDNNTAYARYFPVGARRNRNCRGESVSGSGRRAVLVLPQWNADVEGHVAICRLLNRSGIAALRLSLPYHDRRMLKGFQRADYLVSSNMGRTLQACRQAVLDSRVAISWLAARGYDRIGLIGTSIGSCIGFLTMVHDQRIKAGVFNHVSSYFGDVVWQGISTAHVRRGLESQLTREEVRRAWSAISPNSYVNRLARDQRKQLMISCRYDLTFTPELSKLLFDECDRYGVRSDRRLLPCGHYTLGEAPFKYLAAFLITRYLSKHL
jgi:hypothetical protein